MRVLLFTGKGGAGTTTTAAATAAVAAARGRKTLALSTGPQLADAFGVPLRPEPAEIDTGLYGVRVDGQTAVERRWDDLRPWVRAALARADGEPVQAEELPALPGAAEVVALLELRAQVDSGRWDVVVVDAGPAPEALRLLALPDALRWYLDRVFPAHHRALRA
ncbi:MAG: ArsA family ATPase, partial [Actinomycetota bacterium]|nr:ArsA family ATPase [Actinomycetota bacterium]